MVRSACCDNVGLKKGPWTPEEDQKLLAYIKDHGHGSWRSLPAKAGLQRCGKSCRLRWINYLRPDIKRGKFSSEEEQTIIQLHALLGSRWSAIASHLPGRTDNEIKNFWNTHLKKKLAKAGIDPVTHKPANLSFGSSENNHTKSSTNLDHIAQWESARLEAEARLARESKLSAISPSTLPQFLPPCLDTMSESMFSGSSTGLGEASDSTEIASTLFSKPMDIFTTFSADVPPASIYDAHASWVPVVPILDNPTEQDSIAKSIEGESYVEIGEEREENKTCWDHIFGLVSSSSACFDSPQLY